MTYNPTEQQLSETIDAIWKDINTHMGKTRDCVRPYGIVMHPFMVSAIMNKTAIHNLILHNPISGECRVFDVKIYRSQDISPYTFKIIP